jgi:hypothetical protein
MASALIDGTGRNHDGSPGGDGFDFIETVVSGILESSFSQIHDAAWDREDGQCRGLVFRIEHFQGPVSCRMQC